MTGIRVQKEAGILTLVFDRAEKRNAITDAMYGALADAIFAAEDDRKTRAILIRAEGESFTAGNDIADFAKAGGGQTGGPRNVRCFLDSLAKSTKPIVAAAQGAAVGVGTTMLLHCDLVVLAENAVLITPFVNLGLVPEAASSHLLPPASGMCGRS